MKINVLLIILCVHWHIASYNQAYTTDHTYCTYADEQHFPYLLNLIGSIHEVDFPHLKAIVVFDIGLTQEQRMHLNAIQKTIVQDIEITHPDITTPFVVPMWGWAPRIVRGWYAWKPVAIKQMADQFPYFLCIDAGALVLKSPVALFQHIQEHGYFFMHIQPAVVSDFVIKPVIDTIINQWDDSTKSLILGSEAFMTQAGLMGMSDRIYDSIINPVYEHTFDFDLFKDDGSSKNGYGWTTPEQTIYTIYAHSLGLKTHHVPGWISLNVNNQQHPFHIHWDKEGVIPETSIYHCRRDMSLFGNKSVHIQYLAPAA